MTSLPVCDVTSGARVACYTTHAVDGEPQEEDISEINKKYEVVHAKHLPSIPEEEEEENGRVSDTTVLQS